MLFGNPRDSARYKQVISACALEPDIQVLPAGDMTEIGEKVIRNNNNNWSQQKQQQLTTTKTTTVTALNLFFV